jgi:hypothetical protein
VIFTVLNASFLLEFLDFASEDFKETFKGGMDLSEFFPCFKRFGIGER